MPRMVQCVVLGEELQGLDAVPWPGDLGQRIYANVSQQGWKQWLERLTSIINENGINSADEASFAIIEQHMLGFFFQQNEHGQLPQGYTPKQVKP